MMGNTPESLTGAILMWAVAAVILIFPRTALDLQKRVYRVLGVDYGFSERTVVILRILGVIMAAAGLAVLLWG